MSGQPTTAQPGHLYGVGVGPGDPQLITLLGASLIGSADVIVFHAGTGKQSIAQRIAADLIPESALIEELRYPVTIKGSEHPGGYYAALETFYDECVDRLGAHLAAGRSVVVLAVGDPLFYGSFMYVHDTLSQTYPSRIVPGVTSISAASAAMGTGLCRHEDTLIVLPGTLPVPELARRLADTDAAVIMKLGKTFEGVREAIRQAGLTDRAWYVERASDAAEKAMPLAEVTADAVPYMSIILIPGLGRRDDRAGRASAAVFSAPDTGTSDGVALSVGETSAPTSGAEKSVPGTVYVVGLGPGPDKWLSPEASEVLGAVDHVIGYAPYVARVPQREGLTRHPSGNTVEVDRGQQALALALAGESVAVVSGGDAGVFGMASAVFEAIEEATSAAGSTAENVAALNVPVQIVPGITAAHAASALAGAALGGDHMLLSLSDRLKPWNVIEARLRAAAEGDVAVAIYNPRSASRPDQFGAARTLLLTVMLPGRVVVVARHVGRDAESLTVTTLGDLDPESIDMGCMVIIGSSTTKVSATGRVWTPRFAASHLPVEHMGPLMPFPTVT